MAEPILMEAAIFIGLQASGKSSFFKERFFDTHVRVNLDMLRTRHREKLLIAACLEARQSFVVDNTNPTRKERRPYIEAAREAGFRVLGYYFQSRIEACKLRNERRPADQVVPLPGLLGTHGKLELPSPDEGFDALHYVRIASDGRFVVEAWQHEV
jgi:predicted kinase